MEVDNAACNQREAGLQETRQQYIELCKIVADEQEEHEESARSCHHYT